ncbi:MAG: hypothetical protein Q7T01_01020 [bacterium]|nr:hypothetical protein [bacterium]
MPTQLLMFRTDRLLLALDVCQHIRATLPRYLYDPGGEPKGTPWSFARILATLERIFDTRQIERFKAIACYCAATAEGLLVPLLIENRAAVGETEINVAVLIRAMRDSRSFITDSDETLLRRFFSAIASGELTEADFKEEA